MTLFVHWGTGLNTHTSVTIVRKQNCLLFLPFRDYSQETRIGQDSPLLQNGKNTFMESLLASFAFPSLSRVLLRQQLALPPPQNFSYFAFPTCERHFAVPKSATRLNSWLSKILLRNFELCMWNWLSVKIENCVQPHFLGQQNVVRVLEMRIRLCLRGIVFVSIFPLPNRTNPRREASATRHFASLFCEM